MLGQWRTGINLLGTERQRRIHSEAKPISFMTLVYLGRSFFHSALSVDHKLPFSSIIDSHDKVA